MVSETSPKRPRVNRSVATRSSFVRVVRVPSTRSGPSTPAAVGANGRVTGVGAGTGAVPVRVTVLLAPSWVSEPV
ncbi:unannotated protein [freshwater metagenome]|uniref:Unannotated protein n=1 Tax=freshwater metagenome TaxID=449393 RepID=A0A6J7II73_9ZZZZ